MANAEETLKIYNKLLSAVSEVKICVAFTKVELISLEAKVQQLKPNIYRGGARRAGALDRL